MARSKKTAQKKNNDVQPKKQDVEQVKSGSDKIFTFTLEQLTAAFEKANKEAVELTMQNLKSVNA